jgi:prepilin-type processing-associated H-X9-DG protein
MRVFLPAILIVTLVLVGCKKHKDTAPEPAEPQGNPLKPDPAGGPPAKTDVQRGAQLKVIENLMRNLGIYYQQYSSDHNNRPPRTLDEFKAYVKADPNARNEAAALDRDWLVMVINPPPNGSQILAYEKEAYAKWNNRVVLFGDGHVEHLTDPELQEALKRK